ncbi:MAG: methyltransferase domain-containing protein [Anaerolineales bacterium]
MKVQNGKPVAQQAYDALAESYAQRVDTKPHNAYYERPATLSLLPDVTGKRLLDAGCGPGVYAEWLVEHGAQVVAIDANRKMVRLARERLGDRVQVLLANLEAPLDFLEDASFDVIIAPLAMDYVKDWVPTFREFHRGLKEGSILVFSIEHPYAKYDDHRETSNYFNVERVEYTWRGFGKPVRMPSYRRPLSEVINTLIETGFTLDRILEPQPIEEFKQADPEEYEQLMRSPGFMCVRAVKS